MSASIKQSTEEIYSRVCESLAKNFEKDTNLSRNANDKAPSDLGKKFANWLVAYIDVNNYSPRYVTLIKSAILYKMNNTSEGGIFDKTNTQEIINAISKVRSFNQYDLGGVAAKESHLSRSHRESKRMIPKTDWDLLIGHLGASRSNWGTQAQFMLAASVGCGARPIEWVCAKLVDENTIRIYNAKVKNVNALDKIRPGVFTESQFEKIDPQELSVAQEIDQYGDRTSYMDIWFEKDWRTLDYKRTTRS